MEETHDYIKEFQELVALDVAVPVCCMKALLSVIKSSKSQTWMQLERELREAIHVLKNFNAADLKGRTKISLGSGCDLFMKYVTRAFLEYSEFDACKLELIRRGENFAGMSQASRSKIAEIGHSFVQDGCTVLAHGSSRVVTALLLKASESKQFNIILLNGADGAGKETAAKFTEAGIPTSLIVDSAMGVAMESVDLCIAGAEGVMENGGIVNKIGTYQVAMVAKAMRKPFYVAVESYKFARMYPLSQRDVADLCDEADNFQFTHHSASTPMPNPEEVVLQKPSIDFTPAEYITLLFTDLGVLTPAAVSDELIKLYQ